MKTQLDAFYKHYCENQSEGASLPPPVISAPTAAAIDYSADFAALKKEQEEQNRKLA